MPPPPKQVVHGEIGENPMETLAAVAQDVFMPLLTSPANQQGWPDVVAKEVTENMHKFVSNGEGPTHAHCTLLTLPDPTQRPD